ncbi:MAG: ABC transporter permease [Bacteroidales bacterium]|nr:ABC transporter permease [Bacteroidales bacterium]
MKKLLISVYKESLLLKRDIEGVVLLFLMPVFLVIIIALLQHRTFQSISENKIPVIIIDNDMDTLSFAFREGIKKSSTFEVTEIITSDTILLQKARYEVAKGKYQIGIHIPHNTTQQIRNRISSIVQKQLPVPFQMNYSEPKSSVINLFFDPITKTSFREIARSKLNEFISQTETRIIYKTYTGVIDALTKKTTNIPYPAEPMISFNEDLVSEFTSGIIPNAVQHNVPAWTLFGMFLICIPIAGNIIKERNDGILARLKSIPVSYFCIISGKSLVFITICLLQAAFIVLIGFFIMPLVGLPQLQVHGNWFALFFISLASAFAASGFGLTIGTIATTHVQASTFGSVSTVILAAIGGVWIPVIVMPDVMRRISEFSPMNWGIQGYYDVFLRNANTLEILPSAIKLFIFYGICMAVSVLFKNYKKTG